MAIGLDHLNVARTIENDLKRIGEGSRREG